MEGSSFHVINNHEADPPSSLPPFLIFLLFPPLFFFKSKLFWTFKNENNLSKQGQNLTHTLLSPLIEGKKMNLFTFIFTSGKKYGIRVFCAKFWLEIIFYIQVIDD